MKFANLTALAALAACAYAGTAGAQACTNAIDGTLSSGAPPFVGNTCGKNTTLSPMCGNTIPNAATKGTSIVALNLGTSANFGIQVVSSTAPGFNPEMAFLFGDCTASSSSCPVDDTNGSQTVPTAGMGTYATDMNFDTPGAIAAAGIGYVFITDLNNEAPGCGAYTLTISGTLPVKLQNFSIN